MSLTVGTVQVICEGAWALITWPCSVLWSVLTFLKTSPLFLSLSTVYKMLVDFPLEQKFTA